MRTEKRIGIARVLSKMGYCSRSDAAILVRAGRVTLNGRAVRDPESPVQIPKDRIEVDGLSLQKAPAIYLMMNKPRGVVTTASDEKGRSTVYDFVDAGACWVGPVGRLDKASEGLLLLTNDSEWAAKISAPSSHLDKKYHVQIDCVANADLLARITRERLMDDGSRETSAGEDLRAKTASLLRHGDKNSWLEITLDEGKNRQIRRLFEAVGMRVLRLVRVSIGPLELGSLKKGAVRRLTLKEKEDLGGALEFR